MADEKGGELISNSAISSLGAISKPIDRLVAVVAKGAGKLYEPIHLVRMAKAEAKVAEIKADSAATLEERAFVRARNQEIRRQQNLEVIAAGAIKHLKPGTDQPPPPPPSDDWIHRFFADAQDVTDKELQELWSRLLAQEVSEPSTISKRTLSLVRNLSPKDASLFATLARLAWVDHNSAYVIPIPNLSGVTFSFSERGKLDSYGLDFMQMLTLSSIGFLQPDREIGIEIIVPEEVRYQGRRYILSAAAESIRPVLPIHFLTPVGAELLRIVDPHPHEQYLNDCIELAKKRRIDLIES